MILGGIIGDIIGSYYEEFNVNTKDFKLFVKGSCFTDDTVMTLAVAKWIMNDPTHSHEHLVKYLRELGWHYLGAGYGRRFYCWLRSTNPSPYYSKGNGSAMRVSPIGYYSQSLEEALSLAKISAEVTHNHPEGIEGAQAVAACMFFAKLGLKKTEIKQKLMHMFGYDLDKTIDEIRPSYSFDATCNGTVPYAIRCFLEGNGFEETIRLAISLGGDSDTLACIAGSIAACTCEIPIDIEIKARSFLTNELLEINDNFCSLFV